MYTLTDDWVVLFESPLFKEFAEISDKEKRMIHLIDGMPLPTQTLIKIYQKEKNIVMAMREVIWCFANNRFFRKSKFDTLATVTPTRVYSSNIQEAGVMLCQYLGFQLQGRMNKTLFRQILKYGREAYEANRDKHILHGYRLADLRIFTDNSEAFLERVMTNYELNDLFRQAIMLDRVIKMSWSDRKIHDMHMKWTEEIQKLKCRNCSDDLIWETLPELPDWLELLNSERRIADEGANMHHCIYTNYHHGLVKRSRIAFHVKDTEDFTVMFDIMSDGTIKFSQAYHAWNKSLSDELMASAKGLQEFAELILSMNERGEESDHDPYFLPF